MSEHVISKPLIAIVGATGTGKSALAVELAERFNGEIINADSLQLYKGLPIITNKISTAEQRGIPHHLLDMIETSERPWNITDYVISASRIINEIRSRRKLPIIVGGTNYYIQSLLFEDGLVAAAGQKAPLSLPAPDTKLLQESTEVLLTKLQEIDPVMAKRWHPNDRRKIQRSLEIFLLHGRRASDIYSEQLARKNESVLNFFDGELDSQQRASVLAFWTYCPKDILDKRLDERVDAMIQRGLFDEIDSLDESRDFKRGQSDLAGRDYGIQIAIGYKEFRDWQRAKHAEAESDASQIEKLKVEAIDQVKAHTRQYAKSQVRWIERKLHTAFKRSGIAERFFVLDGQNLSSWKTDVSQQAISIVDAFLRGSNPPNPSQVSPEAARVLAKSDEAFDLGQTPEKWTRHECQLCHIVAVTRKDWEQHIKSRRHRDKLKKSEKLHRSTQGGDQTCHSASPLLPDSDINISNLETSQILHDVVDH